MRRLIGPQRSARWRSAHTTSRRNWRCERCYGSIPAGQLHVIETAYPDYVHNELGRDRQWLESRLHGESPRSCPGFPGRYR